MSTKPLAWGEIRARAVRFVADWRGETRENAEAQTFWNEWFAIFGVQRRRFVTFEQHAERVSTGGRGRVDAFWPGVVVVEHKSGGRSLAEAEDQALDYLVSISDTEHPRQVITSDFGHFRVLDLESGDDPVEFSLDKLPDQLELFGHLAGYVTRTFEREDEVNIRAAELIGQIYDRLDKNLYTGHDLKVFLVRLVFVLFADDAGVWERGIFEEFLTARTAVDGSDTGPLLDRLFRVLDTPEDRRQRSLDQHLVQFPHINGTLFSERLEVPDFDRPLRALLLRSCRFNWSAISPAIFGSMFQSVMDKAERRAIGAHYTSEQNILKVIRPLYLDNLRAEFEAARHDKARLRRLHSRLGSLTFFDPAAGCGNFLVIAYRELRRIELDLLIALRELDRRGDQFSLDATDRLVVDVSQFHAIEYEEFPARIAEVALYLVDHLENMRASVEFGTYVARFPITTEANVHVGNAIRLDWDEVLPASRCSYLLGNPPFHGMAWMSTEQQEDNRLAFADLPVKGLRTGRLDYVACWYARAIPYLRAGSARAAFVSTSSISQGEQARTLGPLLAGQGMVVDFAHRTFRWTSEARGRAAVHCVIVGFSPAGRRGRKPCRLFEYPTLAGQPVERTVKHLTMYLSDGPDIYPARRSTPLLPDLPTATKGSQPTDGRHLLVTPEQYDEVASDPVAARYLRQFMQSDELLSGGARWCLWLVDARPVDLRSSPVLRERLRGVAEARAASKTASVREQAATPALFTQIRQPTRRYLAVPEVSSGNRDYIPAAFLEPEVIAGNKLITFPGAPLWLFGLLQSAAYMAWVRTVVGRLKSDYSISPSLAYFAFPFIDPEHTNRRDRLDARAQDVLDARQSHVGATLADLYDPLAMPADLRAAHRALDRVVDSLFEWRSGVTEAQRLAGLLERYQSLTTLLARTR